LQHGDHDIAQPGFFVLRLAAERFPFVVAERAVFFEVRAVVVDVLAVLEAEVFAAGVGMAVSV
jgi:hypothetical protein